MTPRPSLAQVCVWLALVALMLGLSLSNYQSYQLGTHVDDAAYVTLARSLISSADYGMINRPGPPAMGKYPFAYPLLLVPFVMLFPNDLAALNVPSLLATVFNMAILFFGWRWFCRNKSHWWALAATGLYALAPLTVGLTRRVMSEPVFTTSCLLALLLAERGATNRPGRWWSTAMSATLVMVAYTRTIGWLLVVSVLVYLFWRRGRAFGRTAVLIVAQMAALLLLVVAVTPVGLKDLLPLEYLNDANAALITAPFKPLPPPQADPVPAPAQAAVEAPMQAEVQAPAEAPALPQAPGQSSFQPGGRQVQPLMAGIGRTATVVRDLFVFGTQQHLGKDIRVLVLPIGGGQHEQQLADALGLPWAPLALSYLISALVAAGLWRALRHGSVSLFLVFPVVYFAAICLWFWNDPRLLYPIAPQIFLALLFGVEGAELSVRRFSAGKFSLGGNQRRALLGAAVLVLIAAAAFKSWRLDDSRLHAGDLQARTGWLKANAGPADVIMSDAPEIDYVYSGRHTVGYPGPAASVEELETYLAVHLVRFVVVAPEINWQDSYKPAYSAATGHLLSALDQLSADQDLKLVYASDAQMIKIYEVGQEEAERQ